MAEPLHADDSLSFNLADDLRERSCRPGKKGKMSFHGQVQVARAELFPTSEPHSDTKYALSTASPRP